MNDTIFLETADRIGRRLTRDAIWAGGECNWLGWAMEPVGANWTRAYRSQPGTLYDGTAGIALFLSALHRFTGDALVRTTMLGALNHCLRSAHESNPVLRGSLWNGGAGVALACLEIGRHAADEPLFRRGLDALAATPASTDQVDICNGSAGTIQALLRAAALSGNGGLHDLAAAHGRNLIDRAEKSDDGWSWNTMPGQKNLLGYAHGAAGIGLALLELGTALGDRGFRDAGLHAFRYERSHFDTAQRNWPDFRVRNPDGSAQFMVAWCHGASGIGLSRLRAAQLVDDPQVREEIDAGLQTTAATFTTPQTSYCLCHGAAGNAELFLVGAEVFPNANYRGIAESVAHSGAAQFHATGLPWPCGVLGGGETPNLMLGLAGIGYHYLRLYSPEVPSVLLVTPSNQPA